MSGIEKPSTAKLRDKVVIITGAARGQGAAEAQRLVEEGAFVVVTDVLDDKGQEIAAHLGDRACYRHLDVSRESEWGDLVTATLARFGRIDVLVNNAAVLRVGSVAQMPPEEFRRVIDINLMGTYYGMRAVIPPMVAAGRGSIINIASVNGFVGTPGVSAYAASKHAILGLTKSAAMELAASGVRINAICPGGVDTPMASEALGGAQIDMTAVMAPQIPLGRLARADEMAGLVVYLSSDDSSYCIGSAFTIDGGLTLGFKLG